MGRHGEYATMVIEKFGIIAEEVAVILETKNLTKSYRGKKVVDDLSICVNQGDVYGFLGPNGAGKTTTIRMILGLIKPNQGDVFIDGLSVREQLPEALKHISGIVEVPKFYENLTAHENLMILKRFHKEVPVTRIDEVLDLVDLSRAKNQSFKTFSLGMKQRLGLAATLLNKPKIIILDEPTNGLDPKGVVEIREIIMKLVEMENITVFISSHILHEVELMCNKVAIISKGKLIAEGMTEALLRGQNQSKFTVDDVTQAQNALVAYPNLIIEQSDNQLVVSEDVLEASDVNALLVKSGIKVSGIVRTNKSLEQYFIETVEGGRI